MGRKRPFLALRGQKWPFLTKKFWRFLLLGSSRKRILKIPKKHTRRKILRIDILKNFGDCFKALGAGMTGAPSQGGSDHMNFWPKSKKCPNTPKIEFLSVLTYFNVFKTKNYPNIGLLWVWLWKKILAKILTWPDLAHGTPIGRLGSKNLKIFWISKML